MQETRTFGQILISPPVLLTFLACLAVAALVIWALLRLQRRREAGRLAGQRTQQEGTIERLLGSFGEDKQKLIDEYEQEIVALQNQVAALEKENARLRDRMSSSGVLGLFGGGQRDVVSALLLENEQLHEIIAEKQTQLRDMMSEMTTKLVDRLDEQAQESARAVRYKQALLSAFLQHQEARQLLDRLVLEGKMIPAPPSNEQPEE